MPKRIIVKGTSPYEEKKICMFEVDKKRDVVNIYTENGYGTMTSATLKKARGSPRTGTHLMVNKNSKDPDLKTKTLEEQYNIFMEEQKQLFKLTEGKINLLKTGSSAKSSLQLWYDICNPPSPAPIVSHESEIIENCYNGALIWALPYEGYGYKYDIVSAYPFIMRSDHMQFPIDEGKLHTIDGEEFENMKYFKYGLYHAEIFDVDYRLMKINNKNGWYTHTDLNRAMELNYEIALVDDGKPNALTYSKFVNGAKLFRPYYDYLFPFKKEGHKCIKKYLNCLHGALCETDKTKITTKKDDVIYDDKDIWSMRPVGNDLDDMFNDVFNMEIVKKDKLYVCDYARLKPFLVSKCRYIMSKIIEKNLDNVVHVHTDGLILKQPIHESQKLGLDIGDLKFECEGNCSIKHATSFKFEEINKTKLKTKTKKA